jgi:hypothetical protein
MKNLLIGLLFMIFSTAIGQQNPVLIQDRMGAKDEFNSFIWDLELSNKYPKIQSTIMNFIKLSLKDKYEFYTEGFGELRLKSILNIESVYEGAFSKSNQKETLFTFLIQTGQGGHDDGFILFNGETPKVIAFGEKGNHYFFEEGFFPAKDLNNDGIDEIVLSREGSVSIFQFSGHRLAHQFSLAKKIEIEMYNCDCGARSWPIDCEKKLTTYNSISFLVQRGKNPSYFYQNAAKNCEDWENGKAKPRLYGEMHNIIPTRMSGVDLEFPLNLYWY